MDKLADAFNCVGGFLRSWTIVWTEVTSLIQPRKAALKARILWVRALFPLTHMSTPDTIILDLNKSVHALQKRIDRASGDGYGYVNKIIEDVVDCLWNKSIAISSLMTYAEEQRHQQVDRARNSNAEMIAWDIVEFGRDLYEQLVAFGIYRDNRLRYVFSGRCRADNLMLTYVPGNELY